MRCRLAVIATATLLATSAVGAEEARKAPCPPAPAAGGSAAANPSSTPSDQQATGATAPAPAMPEGVEDTLKDNPSSKAWVAADGSTASAGADCAAAQ